MWIVQLALRRPYTFVVASLLLLIVSAVTITRTPVDIFPNIDIPIISVVWQYTGLASSDFEGRITTPYERVLTTTVNDIEHTESQTLNGIAVVKIFFQPKAKIDMALAQVTAISQTLIKQLPAGTTPPLIITYNASSVPILQLGLSSPTLAEQQLNDYALNFVRTALSTIPGLAIPYPFGGKMPQMMVDIDPAKLSARGLSPTDVVNAISVQNLILPSGTAKLGQLESDIEMNASPQKLSEIADLPIKTVNGAMIYVRDVASVRAGFQVQTNIVHQDGHRGTLLSVYKTGSASTLAIVKGVRDALPQLLTTLPPDLSIKPLFDQSIFVRASVSGVLKEAVIAACLTALMILLFLGKWRHTVVICISIPLSILASICILSALGETINIMTLGGLALAVGILVDDATVEIENIDRNLEMGKEITTAILDGAQQIALPALVSTLCICIVFVPMFFLAGVARYLFVPLAEAVVFAMLASYVLSRTLVPTMVQYFLKDQPHHPHDENVVPASFLGRFQHGFERGFTRLRNGYGERLETCLHLRWTFILIFLGLCLASTLLLATIGQDFFPSVDAGQFRLHMRARTATRIEETANLADQVERFIRTQIPQDEVSTILDNIGLPYSGINTSYANNGTIGTSDVEILCSLNEERHGPTAAYVAKLRDELPKKFSRHRVLLPAGGYCQPDSQLRALRTGGRAIRRQGRAGQPRAGPRGDHENPPGVRRGGRTHPAAFNQPKLHLTVDRSKAEQLGLTERDVANSVLVSPEQLLPDLAELLPEPGQWGQLQPRHAGPAVPHPVVVRPGRPADHQRERPDEPTPRQPGDVQARGGCGGRHPLRHQAGGGHPGERAGARPRRGGEANSPDRRRGATAFAARQPARHPRAGADDAFVVPGAAVWPGLAVVLVYLLIVVNFQSWTDPFIIITGLPGALAGISWMLFITGTTLSVPALMGAIMCIGVATSNSILVVTFAREQLEEHGDAFRAALEAGRTRLRPVIMTAMAMIIGMVPMSLGLGEGGEQNAPLGRAVIGGLLLSTVATLFFVPVVFSVIRGRHAHRSKVPQINEENGVQPQAYDLVESH